MRAVVEGHSPFRFKCATKSNVSLGCEKNKKKNRKRLQHLLKKIKPKKYKKRKIKEWGKELKRQMRKYSN